MGFRSGFRHSPEAGHRHSDPLAVGLLQLAHLGGLLHPEVDLVRVLSDHLQLDVLGLVTHGVAVEVWRVLPASVQDGV